MTRINTLTILFVILSSVGLKAQNLSQQYDNTVTKSNNFQNYKVINKNQISKFWSNIKDSINQNKQEISQLKQNTNISKAQLVKAKNDLALAHKNLVDAQNNIDSISLLGLINLKKGSYNILMWSFILLLSAGCVFLFYQNIAAKKEAIYRIKLFEELTTELKNFKVNANEKEKKLARELQDMRNLIEQSPIR